MKEIKAFVHQHRAADVIEAIKATAAWTAHAGAAEQHHLSVTQVQGTLRPVDQAERHYSVDLGLEAVSVGTWLRQADFPRALHGRSHTRSPRGANGCCRHALKVANIPRESHGEPRAGAYFHADYSV